MAKKKPNDLGGRTILQVRAMTTAELVAEGWGLPRNSRAPTVIVLDDGTRLYASQDEEGNGPGCLFGIDPQGRQFLLI